MVHVALEGQVLEIRCAAMSASAAGALVGLPALDADPTVLDHVEAAEAVGADHAVEPVTISSCEGMASPSSGDGHAPLEADDELASARWRSAPW